MKNNNRLDFMKTPIFLLFFIFGILNAQNKNQKSDYVQKNIESCRISINDSLNIFKIQENLYSNDIEIIVKTENVITKKCSVEIISNEFLRTLNTSKNPLIKINNKSVEGLNITDFTNLIPNKIYGIRKSKYSIIIVELYSFSYSTVGNAYIDLCFKIDKKGKVSGKKILVSKSSITMNRFNKVF